VHFRERGRLENKITVSRLGEDGSTDPLGAEVEYCKTVVCHRF
jgi:hypothetical protein